MIKSAAFVDFGLVTNGAAICVSGINMNIFCCHFELNKVTEQGGAIFVTNGCLNLSKASFFKCYSINNTNDKIFGNTLFALNNKICIHEVSTRLCGASEKLCTDSSICIKNCGADLFCINASNNDGVAGAAIVSLQGCEDADISYMQGSDCYDSFLMEAKTKPITIKKSNFINFAENHYVLAESSSGLITCISCLFWNIINAQLSYASRTVNLINCTSDSEKAESITFISVYNPYRIIPKLKACKILLTHKCGTNKRKLSNFILFVQLISY